MPRRPTLATMANPTPDWLKPENASVLDSPTVKVIRTLARLIGADDPQSQVMGMMAPVVPEGQATLSAPLRKIGRTLANLGDKVGIKAYHGSPHDFDKFSLSKIGTGEGAQAYGHGLYFAENKGTAEFYKKNLSGLDLKIDGKLVKASDLNTGEYPRDLAALDIATGQDSSAFGDARWQAEYQKARKELQGRVSLDKQGRMYEVSINADPEQLLDWDKPLSQQSEYVRTALQSAGVEAKDNGAWSVTQTPSGKWKVLNVWGETAGTFADKAAAEAKAAAGTAAHNAGGGQLAYQRLGGNPVYSGIDTGAASEKLRQAGIPGIKYLDGGSRASGEGSRNYVIFDDSLIDILKKYGVALPVIEGLRRRASANGGTLPANDVHSVLNQ